MSVSFGISDQGFTLKRLADILSDMQTAFSTVQDPATGEMLTLNLADENDPLVQAVNSVSDALSLAWEQLQLCFNQFDPLKATGAGLSGLVQLNGILRKPGSPSTVTLTMTGTPNLYVALGQQAATFDNSVVFDLTDWTFDGSGNATVLGTCTVDGPSAAPAGSVTSILTPVSGWNMCANKNDATLGTDPETDAALSARQQLSTETTARTTVGDIYGNLTDLNRVTFARVYQNNTMETDYRGIPAKSIAVVIVGGDDTEIANTIFAHSPPLPGYFGTTTVNITDEQGIQYGVQFSRPTSIPIFVSATLQITNASLWPTNGPALVQQAILDYALQGAYGLGITSGFERHGYVPGQSVFSSELYTAINSVPGTQIMSLTVGIIPSPVTQFVNIPWNEVAEFDISNISVVVS